MRRYFSWLKQPEWIFAIIALISCLVLVFLIPCQAGSIEQTHLARIWEISSGYMLPNQRLSQGPYFPAAFMDISYRNQYFYDPVDPHFFSNYAHERIDWNNFVNYQTESSYLPTVYFSQAFAMGLLGRIFDAPVLVIYYTCRLLDVLGYILLTFFAIRLIPFSKWLLAVLALAPTVIFQSATLNPDAYTYGTSFLFVAWILKLALQEKRVNWRQFWITIGMITLLMMVKLNAAFLLPLLLFLVWKGFDSKKMLPIMVGVTVILFAICFIGWNLISYASFPALPGYGAAQQLVYVLTHPLKFGATFFHDFALNGRQYLADWVAVLGLGAVRIPLATFLFYGLVLAAVFLFSPAPRFLNARARALLILTGVLGILLMNLVMYLTTTPIGLDSIYLVSGRYYTTLFPVVFLGLLPGWKLSSRLADWVIPILVGVGTTLTLAVYTLGTYLSYYVVCGTSLYTPGLCYQPQYKNWAPNDHLTPPVAQGVDLQQTFSAVCSPLRALRVWNASSAQAGGGETLLILKDAASGAVLAEKRMDNQSAVDHAWLEMTFPAVAQAVGRQYIIEITSDFSDPAAGLSFGVTARREYLYGLIVNNVPADHDLIFQYGCEPLKLLDVMNKKP